MLERSDNALKLLCLLLAALFIFQLTLAVFPRDSLSRLNIPALPSLPDATNATSNVKTAKKEESKPEGARTNAVTVTNSPAVNDKDPGTNTTNTVVTKKEAAPKTNEVVLETVEAKPTNAPPIPASEGKTNPVTSVQGTNNTNVVIASKETVTNATTHQLSGTNSTNVGQAGTATNKTASGPNAKKGPGPGPRPNPGRKGADLPPAMQAKIDKITQSELLGQVMHPQPAALLGIAGKSAFLRSSTGQSGLVKEGDDLGGLKLLRIGTNRVLIEEDGQKKELMIFTGLGGETLLPKQTDKP